MNLRTMLLQAAERYPDRTVLVEGEIHLTYREWTSRVVALADGMYQRGVRHGDRVAIGVRNSIDHVTAFYACQMLGAAAVPFNFRFKPDGIAYIIENSGARTVFVDESLRPDVLAAVQSLCPDVLWISSSDAAGGCATSMNELITTGGTPIHNSVSPDDLSAIIYTSGTTGRPKGVPITHGNAYARLVTYIMSAGPAFDSGAKTLGAAPLYHTVGMHWIFLQTIFVNGTYFPLPRTDHDTIDLVREEGLTYLFGSPTLFRQLLHSNVEEPIESVTDVAYGSAPCEPELLAEMQRCFPNATISEVYGTTELSIPFVTRNMSDRVPGTLRPTGDHRVRIVHPGGGVDELAPIGEVGELLVDMDHPAIFRGYWGPDGEQKTAAKVEDGWYRTGDGFKRDGEENFYFTGRLDDMFVSGGENIQPAEVENILNGHPGVSDAAVVGTPDRKWGEIVTAFVARADALLTAEDLDAFCRASTLDDFKRPRQYHFVNEIPRNPSGKIVRAELRSFHTMGEASSGSNTGSETGAVRAVESVASEKVAI